MPEKLKNGIKILVGTAVLALLKKQTNKQTNKQKQKQKQKQKTKTKQNNNFHVLVNKSRTAWPTKI